MDYHINEVSMRALVQHASSFVIQRSRKNEKTGSIDDWEHYKNLYVLIDRKLTKFC